MTIADTLMTEAEAWEAIRACIDRHLDDEEQEGDDLLFERALAAAGVAGQGHQLIETVRRARILESNLPTEEELADLARRLKEAGDHATQVEERNRKRIQELEREIYETAMAARSVLNEDEAARDRQLEVNRFKRKHPFLFGLQKPKSSGVSTG